MNSKTDDRTKNDRKLWDILLQKVVPTGRNVFGLCSGDTHKEKALDSGWIIYCTNDGNTVASLRECLETGAFFGGSRFIMNSKELDILEAETGKTIRNSKNGDDYEFWMAPHGTPQPEVKSVDVDEADEKITITAEYPKPKTTTAEYEKMIAENPITVHWIADGEVIAVGNSIDLNEYSDKIGSYVRAEIFGVGGILYSQPFILEYDGAPEAEDFEFADINLILRNVLNETLTFLRGIVGMLIDKK